MSGYKFARMTLDAWLLLIVAAMAPPAAESSTIPVTIDTSAEAGNNAYLYFDMVGSGINAATITNLTGETSVLSESPTGIVFGSLSGPAPNGVTLLVDSTYPSGPAAFTEDALNVTLGRTLSFNLQGTGATPISGTDEFAFYILDANSNSLLPSTDPTGAQSLLTLDINGSAPVLTSYSTAVSFTAPVPIPSSLWMILASLPFLLFSNRPRTNLREFMAFASGAMSLGGILLLTVSSAQAQGTPTPISVTGEPIITGVGLDPHLSVTYSGFRLNHATKAFVTTATIYNHSVLAINGPFYVGVNSISDSSVSLFGSGILQNGEPYSPVAINTIPAGQTVTTTLSFNNPNSVAFTVDAGIYDAASAPPVATLTCPTLVPPNQVIFEGSGTAYPLTYTNPQDSIGRTAACSPASGTNLYSGVSPSSATNTLTMVICGSTGGPSLPATCSSTIAINWLATFMINYPTPPPPPYPSNLALIPCSAMAAAFIPGNALPDSQSYSSACGIKGPGTAGFAVWNYGPNDAVNASVTFNVPPTVNRLAWRFSSANSCDPAVPYQIAEYFEGRLIGYAPAAHITCHFPDIPANTGVDAVIGEDSSTADVPAIAVSLAVDPTQNTNPDTSHTSVQLNVGPPIESITVPASIKVQPQTCDYSQSPGFLILINTCGVPPEVDQILVQTVLGAALLVAGAGVDFFDLTNITQTVIFKSLETGSYIR